MCSIESYVYENVIAFCATLMNLRMKRMMCIMYVCRNVCYIKEIYILIIAKIVSEMKLFSKYKKTILQTIKGLKRSINVVKNEILLVQV